MALSGPVGLVWLRRDLRTRDHAALFHALRGCAQVHCVFLFDDAILAPLARADRRVEFIHDSLACVDVQLRTLAGQADAGLIVRQGLAEEEIPRLAQQLGATAVFANHDDEPQSLARDARVRAALQSAGVALHTYKDHVIFERDEVLTLAGAPFSVFTPYKNAWLRKLNAFYLSSYPVERYAAHLAPRPAQYRHLPTLAETGFEPTNLHQLALPTGSVGADQLLADFVPRLAQYGDTRDFPAVKGPSYLSVHLRFGTVSIRELARLAWTESSQHQSPGAAVWLSELVWRDFYHQILAHHPRVVTQAFKPAYDAIAWESGAEAERLFAAWCEGRTGYPLVDAAMAQINQTGYMHNRLRMVVASFLVKDLGIDWRWGEQYFAEQLNDFDLAANNGGWQWAASTGCDAQPYFRIFNPISQSEKFDAAGRFIRRYLPQLAALPDKLIHAPWKAGPLELAAAGVSLVDAGEALGASSYPRPIVDHAEARDRTLARFSVVKGAVDSQ
ncbi:MAG: deoxyribodipyrimidine photo-lyase [Comamonas sp.]|uniref:cryptochrome/photolyase family protein n=1 Tax=Comamonas sp. TaxID=34028 RepID=UPI002FC9A80F